MAHAVAKNSLELMTEGGNAFPFANSNFEK